MLSCQTFQRINLQSLKLIKGSRRCFTKSPRILTSLLVHSDQSIHKFVQHERKKHCNDFLANLWSRNTGKSFFHQSVRFYSLPAHSTLLLPALSPTMEQGSIVRWEIKEGDEFTAGDLLAEIETDKATMGFEAADDGFIAKILLPEGTKDIPLGTLLAIVVENEDDVAAFKDVTADQLNAESVGAPPTSTPPTQISNEPVSPTSTPPTNLPPHEKVVLPALSPTMTTGSIVAWEINEGDKIEEGDAIATIETDKASMALEYQDEGYLAKILLQVGAKDLPLGTPLCIIVENESDIAAFADYTDSGSSPSPSAAAGSEAQPQSSASTLVQPPIPTPASTPTMQSGDRVFASPLAKKMAGEQGIALSQLAGQGSGPGGRIRAIDLSKASSIAKPSAVTPAPSATSPVMPTQQPQIVDGKYSDIPLTNIRKVTAKRLLESKQNIPHYYLVVDVEMDKILAMRKQFNSELQKDGSKISVNDFIIKAAALSCLKVPEANSSWRDTFIRRHTTVDMSVAVSTDDGLITPIVFDAHNKGLEAIAKDVVSLATKAREGKLQPQEFMGGTFTISNLGMFGIKQFSAIINPPQACILAVGSARGELVPDESNERGFREANVISATLSCDHRVVDGAVGAKWLQFFKKYMEDPTRMLL